MTGVTIPEPITGLFWPPGNPASCTDAGASTRGMADACGQVTSWVESAHPEWEGEAGVAYVVEAGQVGQHYSATATALTAGAAALQVYGEQLAQLQRRARMLEADVEQFERARMRLIEEVAMATAAAVPLVSPIWQQLVKMAGQLDEQRAELVGRNTRIKSDTDQAEQDAARALNRTGGLTPAARQARTDPPPAPPTSSGDHWWNNIDPQALLDVVKDAGWTALGGLMMAGGVLGFGADVAGEIGSAGVLTPAVAAAVAGEVALVGGGGTLAGKSLQKLIKDAGRVYSDNGSGATSEPPKSGADGPGKWKPVKEHMSDSARGYQEKVTGHSSDHSYVVDRPDGRPVKFDGFDDNQNALIDAKGPRWEYLLKHPKISRFARSGMLSQAERQTQAAGDTRIIWYVNERGAANRMADILANKGYENIDVEWRP